MLLGQRWQGGTAFGFMAGSLPPGATLTRASTGWYFDSAGVLQSAANDAARFNYNPDTLALQGLLVEPPCTNGIRNNTMIGTVAGTPGTAPTNWVVTSTINNVTREIVGSGVEDGIAYIDIRYYGTPSASAFLFITFEGTTVIAGMAGQTWTASVYCRLIAGALTNISVAQTLSERSGAGSTVDSVSSAMTPTGTALRTQRHNLTRLYTNASTLFSVNYISIAYTSGQALDVTLRIGLPQLEQGSGASSPIKTSSAAVARAADVLSLAMVDGTYDIDITRLSGVTNVVGAVVSGGAYTVPTDLSPLQSVVARRVG